MGSRGFCVKIELDLQAVTCPGVWLCPNGKVALRLNVLDRKIESRRSTPAFPLICHEKFRLEKLFTGVGTLAELQNSLGDEYLYAELVQWSSPRETSLVLATFETNLAELLYPASCSRGLHAGSEVDLLMEPTKYFPGILAPKIEVSTRTIIEEVTGILKTSSGAHMINPKTINSKTGNCMHRKRPAKGIIRQRKVCHAQTKPDAQDRATVERRASTDGTFSSLSSGSIDGSQPRYERRCRGAGEYRNSANVKSIIAKNRDVSSSHAFESCPVCSRYECYFMHDNEERGRTPSRADDDDTEDGENRYDSSKFRRRSRCDRENNGKTRPRSAQLEHSSNVSPSSSVFRSKVKELERQSGKSTDAAGDVRVVDYFKREDEHGRQGFYKNLEKFYKRMYKQAKIRARAIDCS